MTRGHRPLLWLRRFAVPFALMAIASGMLLLTVDQDPYPEDLDPAVFLEIDNRIAKGDRGKYLDGLVQVWTRVRTEPHWFSCPDVHVEITFDRSVGRADTSLALLRQIRDKPKASSMSMVLATTEDLPLDVRLTMRSRQDRNFLKNVPVKVGSTGPASRVASARVRGWQPGTSILTYSFDAHWSRRRSLGSCYVVLPRYSLRLQDILELRDAIKAAGAPIGARVLQVPSQGRSDLIVQGGTLDRNSTFPQPTLYQKTTWECRDPDVFEVNEKADCGAVAVVSRHSVVAVSNFLIFVAAALFSLGLESAYQRSRATDA